MKTRVQEQRGNWRSGFAIEALQLSCRGAGHCENDQVTWRGGISTDLPLRRRSIASGGLVRRRLGEGWIMRIHIGWAVEFVCIATSTSSSTSTQIRESESLQTFKSETNN